jgi:HEPN domain-containing protein
MNALHLQPIIEKLAKQLDLEKIYHLHYTLNDKPCNKLLLLLTPQCQQSLMELEPIAQMILEESALTYSLHKSPDIKQALLNDHPFYMSACTKTNLVFTNEKNDFSIPNTKKIQAAKNAAQTVFRQGMEKVHSFVEGAQFYHNKENYALTAFMLHQVVELTYKTMAQALFKKNKHSHHIKTHINTVTAFLPELSITFPQDNEAERDLLKSLDNAYLAVRYKNNFQIEPEILEILFERVDQLQKLTTEIFADCMDKLDLLIKESSIKDSIADAPIQGSTVTEFNRQYSSSLQQQLDYIVKQVLAKYNAECIYLLSEQYTSCTRRGCFLAPSVSEENFVCNLFIISGNNTKGISAFTKDRLTAHLLVHDRESVSKAIASGNRFFLTVLQTASLLYRREGITIPHITPYDWQKIYLKAKSRWEYRLRMAKGFLNAANGSHHEIGHEQEIALFLLTQFCEQICLGLIQVFLGYKPNTANIRSLITLSKLCTTEVCNILHTLTENDRYLLKLLSNSLNDIRFKEDCDVDFDDVNQLIYRCEYLLERLEILCEVELDLLKLRADQSMQNKLSA